MSTVEHQVIEIVSQQLGIEKSKIHLNSTFEDLGADSLDTVELVMAFEEKFETEIPDEDAEKIRTIAQAIEFIEQHQG